MSDAPDPRLSGLDRIILQFRAIKRDLAELERIWERDHLADNLRRGPDCQHPDRR